MDGVAVGAVVGDAVGIAVAAGGASEHVTSKKNRSLASAMALVNMEWCARMSHLSSPAPHTN